MPSRDFSIVSAETISPGSILTLLFLKLIVSIFSDEASTFTPNRWSSPVRMGRFLSWDSCLGDSRCSTASSALREASTPSSRIIPASCSSRWRRHSGLFDCPSSISVNNYTIIMRFLICKLEIVQIACVYSRFVVRYVKIPIKNK